MKKSVYIFLGLSLFYSCDPLDGRLNVKNNSSESLFVRFRFIKEIKRNEEAYETSELRVLEPFQKQGIGIFNKWEDEFERARPDTTIHILIMKKQNVDSIILKSGVHIILMSLKIRGMIYGKVYIIKKNMIIKNIV